MKTPTAAKTQSPDKPAAAPLAPGAETALGTGTVAPLSASGAAPGLPADDPLRDPAAPLVPAAPTLDPERPDPVPGREPPGEAINAGLARSRPAGAPEIGAQTPGREGLSGSTDGVAGRGTLVEEDRTGLAAERAADVAGRTGEVVGRGASIEGGRAGFDPRLGGDAFDPGAPREAEAGRAILVSCQTSRRRAGFAFGPNPRRLLLADLTGAEIAAIEGDLMLSIRGD